MSNWIFAQQLPLSLLLLALLLGHQSLLKHAGARTLYALWLSVPSVSYTHLDVYKRQACNATGSNSDPISSQVSTLVAMSGLFDAET